MMTRNEVTRGLERLKNDNASLLHQAWMDANLKQIKDISKGIKLLLDDVERTLKNDMYNNL